MSGESTTYSKRRRPPERVATGAVEIPGVPVSDRQTRDIVSRGTPKRGAAAEPPVRTGTRQLPFMNPADAPAHDGAATGDLPPPPGTRRPTLGIETRDPTPAPSQAPFQPPWASSAPVPAASVPVAPSRRPTAEVALRQVFVVLSCEPAATELANLPGLSAVVRVPVIRVEATFATQDEAFAAAARFNREQARSGAQGGRGGRVFSVRAATLPDPQR